MIFTILRKTITQYRMDSIKQLFFKLQQATQQADKLQILNQITSKTNQHVQLSIPQIQVVRRITNEWLTRRGRQEKIASVAFIMMKTKIKSQEAMQELLSRIENDQWYVNFQQSVKALQILAHLRGQKHRISDELFDKVQHNITLTIWQVNMQYYQRIVRSLAQAQRANSPLFSKVQSYIVRNLEMHFDQQIILSILRSYSSVNRGSFQLYTQISRFLIGTNVLNRNTKNILSKDGKNLGFLLQAFGVQVQRGMQCQSGFYEYVGQFLAKKNLNFQSLQQVQRVLVNLQYFQFQDQLQIMRGVLSQAKLVQRLSFPEFLAFRATLQRLQLLQHGRSILSLLQLKLRVHNQTDQTLLLILQSQQNQKLKEEAIDQIQKRFMRLSAQNIGKLVNLLKRMEIGYRSEQLKFLNSRRESLLEEGLNNKNFR